MVPPLVPALMILFLFWKVLSGNFNCGAQLKFNFVLREENTTAAVGKYLLAMHF